jgi:hypothetical protein
MTRPTNSSLSEHREPAGLARDIDRLKRHGGMSLSELRDFIKQLHGRKPSEVLGIVSSSALIRAMVESTVYLGIGILVLTIIPFMMADDKGKPVAAADSSPSSGSEATPPVASAVTDTAARSTTPDGTVSAEDAGKAVDVMGLGETKTADPNKNPLDNIDNLLDDVK